MATNYINGPQQIEDAYESAHNVTQATLARIKDLLFDLPAPDSGMIDWGHIGSLNGVNARLSEVVEHLESIIN